MVVLAAGSSTRLGSPKTLARVRGTSLIRNTVRLLDPLGNLPIIVVIPARAARVRAELRGLPVHFVENPQRAQGLSTSVRRGLAAAYCGAAVLLVPVDLARLQRRDIERLLSRWRGSRRRLVATRFDRHGGAPLIVPRWLQSQALAISGEPGPEGSGEPATIRAPDAPGTGGGGGGCGYASGSRARAPAALEPLSRRHHDAGYARTVCTKR